jgi:FkbM family methyltransferase
MYSQNNEDDLILSWFQGKKGTVVEIGANDGTTLSNSKLLIDNGWNAHLFEPSFYAYQKLKDLHKENKNVQAYHYGISSEDGVKKFFESGALLGESDTSLVSSVHADELKRWGDSVKFLETYANFLTWESWMKNFKIKEDTTFDYLSIDAEGDDWNILQQIDLKKHSVSVLCVEWNSLKEMDEKFTSYTSQYGMKELTRNAENIIYTI